MHRSRRRQAVVTTLAIVLAIALLPLAAPVTALPSQYPTVIPLPTGFQPEGIVVAPDGTAYAGSLADGSIVAASLLSGEVQMVYEADDTPAVGIEYDDSSHLLYVAGGESGALEAVNPWTGGLADRVALVDEGFINDVAVHGDTAYVTNSFGASVYAVELTSRGAFGTVEEITLGGDFEPTEGFNANGIVALPDGTLIVVQSSTGTLFTVDPDTGEATAIELRGALTSVPNGDGLELEGLTLYVVQNQLNQIAVVDLAGDGDPGTATVAHVLDGVVPARLDAPRVPTTVDRFADRLYVVNARFGVEEPDEAAYQIVGTELR